MKLPLCETGIVYLRWPSARSCSVNSSMVGPWQPTATEGTSKFMSPMEVVTMDR